MPSLRDTSLPCLILRLKVPDVVAVYDIIAGKLNEKVLGVPTVEVLVPV